MFIKYGQLSELCGVTETDMLQREAIIISTRTVDTGKDKTIFPKIGDNVIVVSIDKLPEGYFKVQDKGGKPYYISQEDLEFLPNCATEIEFILEEVNRQLKTLNELKTFASNLEAGKKIIWEDYVFFILSSAFNKGEIKDADSLTSILKTLGK